MAIADSKMTPNPAAYGAGYAAGQRDDTANPYPEGTESHVMWTLGWNTAFIEAKRQEQTP